MNIIYMIRGGISRFVKRFNLPIMILLKFAAYFWLFHYVAGIEGFPEGLRIDSLPVQLILAALSTILPNRCGVFLAIVLGLANIWKLTMVGTGVAGILFLAVYIMTSRMFPDQVYMLVLVPLCLHYKMYLLLPAFAGMYIGVITIIPMICGVIFSILLGLLPEFMALQMPEKLDAIPQMLSNIFKYVFNQILHNDMLIFLMILFTVVVILIYLLRKIEISYGNYITLAAGIVLGIICIFMGQMTFDISEPSNVIIWRSVLAFILLAVAEFMHKALDYEATQRLSFEDDEYEYHVTVIPKIDISRPNRRVQTITDEEEVDEADDIEELDEEKVSERTPVRASNREDEAFDLFEDEPDVMREETTLLPEPEEEDEIATFFDTEE